MVEEVKPKVAILMSVYHKERPEFLKEAMESIFKQTYPHVDFHLFKDGPLGDDLNQVLDSFSKEHSNLILHEHPENRCLAVCLNDLISKIKLDYSLFARMDSDDVSYPDRLEKQVAFMQQNPDVDVCGGYIVDMDERGKELKQVKYPLIHEQIKSFFIKRNPIAHVTVMYRNTFFDKAGLYPPIRLEDGLYWMKGFMSGCRFQNIPENLVAVRMTDDFLQRRSGFKRVWGEFKVRLTINKNLKFGVEAFMFALATFCVQLLPISIKQVLYNKLR